MAVLTRAALEQAALEILDRNPDAVVRVRLLRDVLGQRAPQHEVWNNALVRRLAAEQRGDGSWGRFHSGKRSSKQMFGTTEFAVARAIEFGIQPSHPMRRRASRYIVSVLRGRTPFPETEKNDRWP